MSTAAVSSPWLRSAASDGFWLLSGLWLPAVLLLLAPIPGATERLLVWAVFLLWLPHRFATAFSAWCTPAYRPLLREQWLRFAAAPAALVAATFLFVFAPVSVLPLDHVRRIQVLATLFLAYNSWHFALQHYGVLSIYRARAGQQPGGWLKQYEKWYCVAVGMAVVVVAQIGHGAEIIRDSLLREAWPTSAGLSDSAPLQWSLTGAVLVLTAVLLLAERREPQPSRPKQLYAASLALQGLLAPWLDAAAFFLLWGVQHWLVSLGLLAHMTAQHGAAGWDASPWYAGWRRIAGRSWSAVAALVIGTVALVPLFDLAVHPHNDVKAPLLAALCHPLLERTWLSQLFVALNFGTLFVHFAMDRAVFRFSDRSTRQITGRLLFARPSTDAAAG